MSAWNKIPMGCPFLGVGRGRPALFDWRLSFQMIKLLPTKLVKYPFSISPFLIALADVWKNALLGIEEE